MSERFKSRHSIPVSFFGYLRANLIWKRAFAPIGTGDATFVFACGDGEAGTGGAGGEGGIDSGATFVCVIGSGGVDEAAD